MAFIRERSAQRSARRQARCLSHPCGSTATPLQVGAPGVAGGEGNRLPTHNVCGLCLRGRIKTWATRRSREAGGLHMGILSWILLGLVAGFLAKLLMPGQGPAGFVVTILLGIVGALVGGYLGSHFLGLEDVTGFDLRSVGLAVGGAVIVLLAYGALKRAKIVG